MYQWYMTEGAVRFSSQTRMAGPAISTLVIRVTMRTERSLESSPFIVKTLFEYRERSLLSAAKQTSAHSRECGKLMLQAVLHLTRSPPSRGWVDFVAFRRHRGR